MASNAVQTEPKLSTNPRFFPADRTPAFIVKLRNGHFSFVMKEPGIGSRYLWYMSSPKQVDKDELFREMQVPGRRWYACDKSGYKLQKEAGASTTTGEPFICLQNINEAGKYWFGKRHGEPAVEEVTLVLTIAEVYLKSTMHQKRYISFLIDQVKRVLNNREVLRSGNTMVEVRKIKPTQEQLKLLALIPGIGKIYEGVGKKRTGDPRGELLLNGVGGVPIDPNQHVLALVSGGIDSPVAAYRMMTRGCFVSGIHFLNSTSDTASVVEKNRCLAQRLSLVQGRFEMFYVDISKLQTQIVAKVPNINRTLIYKWCMLSLSAGFDKSHLLLTTGDSASQVASQTVYNLSVLYPTVNKAIVSPLIGLAKMTIIEEARKIGTYDISIREGADCCQYMMCKTGANLCMGRQTLERYVRQLTPVELPVVRERFRDGGLHETTRFTYTPAFGLRATAEAPTGPPAAPADEVVYFDAAAGTRLAPAVRAAMNRAPEGNPTSLHETGRAARMAVEAARASIAAAMGVPAGELIFTSGGTESNHLALHGYRVRREAWSHASTRAPEPGPAGSATGRSQEPTVVRVVDLVNHETGSVTRDLTRPANGRLHVDASQAFLKIDFRSLDLSQVDSMTVTAHKVNGPVGIAALYLRGLVCNKQIRGGSQEKGIRPGTENVPAIVGFATALELDRSGSQCREIEAYIVKELEAVGCEINRRGETSGYIVHATLPEGYNNTEVVSLLSTKYRVEIGTGSACKTNVLNTTVYDTLGKEPHPERSIRLSWDDFNTMEEAKHVIKAFRKVLAEKKPSRR